jgi:hypothetical protein
MAKTILYHLDRSFVPPPFDGFTVSVQSMKLRQPGHPAGKSLFRSLGFAPPFFNGFAFSVRFNVTLIFYQDFWISQYTKTHSLVVFL